MKRSLLLSSFFGVLFIACGQSKKITKPSSTASKDSVLQSSKVQQQQTTTTITPSKGLKTTKKKSKTKTRVITHTADNQAYIDSVKAAKLKLKK
jgi:ABC-type Fe3+-hydroxamate transport system substrate-binding protein